MLFNKIEFEDLMWVKSDSIILRYARILFVMLVYEVIQSEYY